MKHLTALPAVLVLFGLGSAFARDLSSDDIDLSFDPGLILPRQTVKNLQVFTGALGGAAAPAITQSDDPKQPFEVDGDKFNDFKTAANRACDNQHNTCADLANNKTGKFSVGQCDQQSTQCKAAIDTATQTSFNALFSSTAEFDIFCDT